MLSSDAEHFYWLSRYAERAENTARLVNVNVELMLDFPGDKSKAWKPVIEITGMEDFFSKKNSSFEENVVINFLTFDKNNPNSILSSLASAQYNSKPIRDNLPRASSEQLSFLINNFIDVSKSKSNRKRSSIISSVISNIQLFFGIISDNFVMGTEYQFIKLGRFIERADMISRIVDAQCIKDEIFVLGEEYPTLQWTSILRSLSAYEAYRISQGTISKGEIINFLIKNGDFPKSIVKCLSNVQEAINNLPNNKELKKSIDQILNTIINSNVNKFSNKRLHDFIDNLQKNLLDLDMEISKNYF